LCLKIVTCDTETTLNQLMPFMRSILAACACSIAGTAITATGAATDSFGNAAQTCLWERCHQASELDGDHVAFMQSTLGISQIGSDQGDTAQSTIGPSSGAPSLSEQTVLQGKHADKDKSRLRQCVDSYANGLDDVESGLGSFIRGHPLFANYTNWRPFIWGAGSGSTATGSLFAALLKLNFNAVHAVSGAGVDLRLFERFMHTWHEYDEGSCRRLVRSLNLSDMPENVDAVVDTPASELFIDIFLAYPKARFILTVRPAEEWAHARRHMYDWVTNGLVNIPPDLPVPIQEPCGDLTVADVERFSEKDLATLFSLQNDLVRCAVPQERLFEIDVFTQNTAHVMSNLSRFLNVPDPGVPYPHCSGSAKPNEDPDCPGKTHNNTFLSPGIR